MAFKIRPNNPRKGLIPYDRVDHNKGGKRIPVMQKRAAKHRRMG